MKLFTYEVAGKQSCAVMHVCLQCDKPVLIDTDHLHVGELYFCTYCGLDWRLAAVNADEVSDQFAELVEKMVGIKPASA